MDLLNLKVRHKVFGSGIVTDVNGEYLTVQFESKEAKFVYPDAFEDFLIAEDDAVQTFILEEVNLKKKPQMKNDKQQKPRVRLKQSGVWQKNKQPY